MDGSIVFVTSSRCRGITRRLRMVAGEFPDQVAMTASADPKERGEAIAAAYGLLLIDGHHTDPGCVDGLGLGLRKACPGIKARVVIVGCCYSAERDFTDAVRPGLDRQVAYLGYGGMAPHDHAEIVFPLFSVRFSTPTSPAQPTRQRTSSTAHWHNCPLSVHVRRPSPCGMPESLTP